MAQTTSGNINLVEFLNVDRRRLMWIGKVTQIEANCNVQGPLEKPHYNHVLYKPGQPYGA